MILKHRFVRFLMLPLCLLLLNGCGSQPKPASNDLKTVEDPVLGLGTRSETRALVYKTKGDYYDRVPVLMNAERNRIVAYPDPVDLYQGTVPSLPTKLKDGYLLDNRGIGSNVAFLTYTYQTYGALEQAPSMQQLMDSLLDRNPLTELWDCGSRSLYQKETEELNALIDEGFQNKKALIEVLRVNP
jgi:hypothetical protein